MSKAIDLSFRPATYFGPQRLERYLLGKVKGAVLRKRLQALFDAGRHDEVHTVLTADGISAADRKALEAIHPMFMGGNYLPDTEDGEVEIARIRIKSTTFDVTSVYARAHAAARMPGPSTAPSLIDPSLRHTSCEVVPGAVVLLQLVELGVRDEAQRLAVSGIDMHIGECGLQRSAMEDHELHQLVQGLPVLGTNRVGR